MKRRPIAAALVLIVLIGLSPKPGLADDEEDLIRLLVPAGAGGGTDAIARRLALLLNEPLGRPVTVVNRPGGDGRAMIEALRGAPPDGLTLGLLTGQATAALPDQASALSPILLVNFDPPALHVRAGDDPDAATAGVLNGTARASGGRDGSIWHMALAGHAAVDRTALPTGAWQPIGPTTAAIEALEEGEVRLVVAEAAQGAAARRNGALAVSAWPGGTTLGGWRGLVGPPGLSDRRIEAVARAARLAAGRAEFRAFMELRGFSPADLGPDEFRDFLGDFRNELAEARAALE